MYACQAAVSSEALSCPLVEGIERIEAAILPGETAAVSPGLFLRLNLWDGIDGRIRPYSVHERGFPELSNDAGSVRSCNEPGFKLDLRSFHHY